MKNEGSVFVGIRNVLLLEAVTFLTILAVWYGAHLI